MIVTFDIGILKPGNLSLDLMGTSVESGRSMSGITGAIDYSAGGFWGVEYKNIFIETRLQHVYWSYLRNNLSGGVTKVDVQIEQRGSAPLPGSVESVYPLFGDDATFDDNSTFETGSVTAFVGADAETGDGTVSINMIEAAALIGGETFGVYHPTAGWRTYSVSEIDAVSGTVYTLGIRPPLRGTMAAGDVVEFLKPKCSMRLMPSTKLPAEIKPPWHNTASASFVEAF